MDYNKICSDLIEEWYKIAPFSHITAEKTYRTFDNNIEVRLSWVVRGQTYNICRLINIYEISRHTLPMDMIRVMIKELAREYYNTLIIVKGESND